ncbi:response regulator [Tropicimonas sp. IMCC6043]|uniref:response regulator n=1 Tax=Tropicimonas sp. IMCC6043 TaxID=2510645 RepID=UPI00101BAA81|nr:response regulator [Tropicimonas sp. IMCC6043]RYH11847.1 response regulator [Tropicimonas sp. IMCC6043]
MNVLVVEDDPNLATLWKQVLERAGHKVLSVESQTAALASLQQTPQDLVILDLCLNGRNALGVATLATYRNPRCKVVVVCGSATNPRRNALFAMSPAVAATLHKPVDIEDLVEVCETIVRQDGHPAMPVVEASVAQFRQ